jgi:hypothetical protein
MPYIVRFSGGGARAHKLDNSSLGWEAGEASFGWQQIVDVYDSMEVDVGDGSYRPVRIFVRAVAYPDKASLMRVPDAKVPFQFDMITHQISALTKKLKCAEELHKVRNTLEYEAGDADRLEAFLSVLLSAVTLAPPGTIPSEIAAQERIRSEIA